MKNSLKKLRGFSLNHHKHDRRDRKIQPLAQLDELAKASEDMEDTRACYDSLLSAAAGAANSAYESLHEMGVCLLQKVAVNEDEETGKAMLMLGKVQFELQRLVDIYRSHITQTITIPSESLLNELRTVEEMKQQCDDKRELYEYMRSRCRERGRSRSSKEETFSSQQLQAARDEFDEEATLFVFRLKSLKQGQSRSLLTQAARHHAAQLNFFKKAVKSLEAVEPHVKSVTEQQHIDYYFKGLEDDSDDGMDANYKDDDEDDDVYDDDTSSCSSIDNDGELSFDYRHSDLQHHLSSVTRKESELDMDITFPQVSRVDNAKENLDTFENSYTTNPKIHSQSAPLFPQRKLDPTERIRQFRPSSTRKIHSYALPTPGDTKRSISTGSQNTFSSNNTSSQHTPKLYHSYPLELRKYVKLVGTKPFLGPITQNSQTVLKESNKNKMPPPLTEINSSSQIKMQSFSGPLTTKPISTMPPLSATIRVPSLETMKFSSGPILKVSLSNSPTFTSSPRISELHELPRPPAHLIYSHGRSSGFVGYSAPLVSRNPENFSTNKAPGSKTASPLPTPPNASPSSPNLPLSSPRAVVLTPSQVVGVHGSSRTVEAVASPPSSTALSSSYPT